jgi:hypothetical protein
MALLMNHKLPKQSLAHTANRLQPCWRLPPLLMQDAAWLWVVMVGGAPPSTGKALSLRLVMLLVWP